MQNEPITIYKLIILYMLDKVSFPLTNKIISDYIIENGYTNFFNLQTAYSELLDVELITSETTYRTTYYHLSEKGKETLDLFHAQLSIKIRKEIVDYLKENQYVIVEKSSVFSDYQKKSNGDYISTLILKENNQSLLELNLTVASEKEASRICASFSEKNGDIYQYIIQTLLS